MDVQDAYRSGDREKIIYVPAIVPDQASTLEEFRHRMNELETLCLKDADVLNAKHVCDDSLGSGFHASETFSVAASRRAVRTT